MWRVDKYGVYSLDVPISSTNVSVAKMTVLDEDNSSNLLGAGQSNVNYRFDVDEETDELVIFRDPPTGLDIPIFRLNSKGALTLTNPGRDVTTNTMYDWLNSGTISIAGFKTASNNYNDIVFRTVLNGEDYPLVQMKGVSVSNPNIFPIAIDASLACTTPQQPLDLATKEYVDNHSSGGGGDFLPLSGGTLTGAVSMSNNKITDVATPTASTDVATKGYVDSHSGGSGSGGDALPLSGGTMTGVIDMNANAIVNLPAPTTNTNPATKLYVDTANANYLLKVGGQMSGQIDMGNHKIVNVATPFATGDVVNKQYVDDNFLNRQTGGGMSADLDMNTQKVVNLGLPSDPNDAASKKYVDETLATDISCNTLNVGQGSAFGGRLFLGSSIASNSPIVAGKLSTAGGWTAANGNVFIDYPIEGVNTGDYVYLSTTAFFPQPLWADTYNGGITVQTSAVTSTVTNFNYFIIKKAT